VPGALLGSALLTAQTADAAANASANGNPEPVKIPSRPWKIAFEEHYMTSRFDRIVRKDTKVAARTGV
jgi:hypothetical protein